MRDRQKKVMGIAVLSAMVAAVVTACGGSDGPVVAPQLSAAQAAAFVGDCADLTAKISALPNTGITAVNKIVAGTVMAAQTARLPLLWADWAAGR